MKQIQSSIVARAVLLLASLVTIAACKNENDWAMKKGASPEYVPHSVSRKTYR